MGKPFDEPEARRVEDDPPRPTKVLSVRVMLICHNGQNPQSALESLEHNHPYLSPRIVSYDEMEVPWTDEHPLNQTRTWKQAFFALFGGG